MSFLAIVRQRKEGWGLVRPLSPWVEEVAQGRNQGERSGRKRGGRRKENGGKEKEEEENEE